MAGFFLHMFTRVPWVADMRDLWTQDSYFSWPSRLHYRATAAGERFMLRHANNVIANTELAADRMCRLLGKDRASRIVVIPNGYDKEDIPISSAIPPQSSKPLTIVHVGAFHDGHWNASSPPSVRFRCLKRSLGLTYIRKAIASLEYHPAPLDPWMRSPKCLLDGIHLLLERHPELRQSIRIRLIGYLQDGWHSMIRTMGLQGIVETPGYMPHAESVRALVDAHVLFCVQIGFADTQKPVPYVPAKLYEYIAVGKPILAPLTEGDAKGILEKSGLGFAADPRDAHSIARVVLDLYTQHCNGGIRVVPNWEFIRSFERKQLTGRLAALFDDLALHRVQNARVNR